jgi:hypothetical protein
LGYGLPRKGKYFVDNQEKIARFDKWEEYKQAKARRTTLLEQLRGVAGHLAGIAAGLKDDPTNLSIPIVCDMVSGQELADNLTALSEVSADVSRLYDVVKDYGFEGS